MAMRVIIPVVRLDAGQATLKCTNKRVGGGFDRQ
jgi:hypothetical protein